uniref:Sugar phosphate transporter domain-containing protein n=1 Tax=Glycine max TaxID=3847 RepID=A0A0R0F6T6_SOYBN
MVSLVKYTALPLTSPDSSSHVPRPQLCALPSVHNVQQSTQPSLSSLKPLYISSTQNFAFRRRRVPECQAYEADRSRPLELNIELPDEEAGIEATQRIKIGLYFATWWALNVVFNIYNKKVLNAFPYPWLTSTLSLAAGSLMMLISWATKVAELPKVDFQFWKALFPVAVLHTIGHVAATVSMSKVAVSFTHIIKSAEPAFSVLVSRFLLGEAFPGQVYLSLVPIIGGCALAAVTELNFNMIGFMGAMISNLAFVLRNIFSKKGMKGMSVSGMNYYACLSILSLLILTPFAIAVEGPKMWAAGWQTALSEIGPNFVWWVAAQSVFYHLYNQVSYMSLDQISPLTFSIGNTMKRISVIVSSILIFHTPIQPVNALGAAIAILGTFLYSQVQFRSISDESNGDVAVDQYHRYLQIKKCLIIGDRVKYWATFNEPNFLVPLGYRSAMAKCSEGDSEKEPFIAAHNVILSHAAAVDIHRTKCQWFEPMSNSTADKLATERARAFSFNWFLDPIIFGKYPTEMENVLGSLLPKFSSHEKEKLKKGLDFIGLNYYTAFIFSFLQTPFSWFNIYIYPDGMEKAVTCVRDRYNNTPIFITENVSSIKRSNSID